MELRLARTEQIHTCRPRRCLVYDSQGNLYCKRGTPFEISQTDYIHQDGSWCMKRLHGYVNDWNRSVLVYGGCNNDIKLLTSGDDTRNVTYYSTNYGAKGQSRSHNLSAILANGFAYHLDHANPAYVDSIRDHSCFFA